MCHTGHMKNILETIGAEYRDLAEQMLRKAETALSQLGIGHFTRDRQTCALHVFVSGRGSFAFHYKITALPASGCLGIFLVNGSDRPSAAIRPGVVCIDLRKEPDLKTALRRTFLLLLNQPGNSSSP